MGQIVDSIYEIMPEICATAQVSHTLGMNEGSYTTETAIQSGRRGKDKVIILGSHSELGVDAERVIANRIAMRKTLCGGCSLKIEGACNGINSRPYTLSDTFMKRQDQIEYSADLIEVETKEA
jgi:hypothetical protein